MDTAVPTTNAPAVQTPAVVMRRIKAAQAMQKPRMISLDGAIQDLRVFVNESRELAEELEEDFAAMQFDALSVFVDFAQKVLHLTRAETIAALGLTEEEALDQFGEHDSEGALVLMLDEG